MDVNDINNDKNIISESILENLRPFNKHINSTCMECGYSGLMGLQKDTVPWYISWPVFVIACLAIVPFFTSSPFIVGAGIGVVFALIRHSLTKKILLCPNCKETLITK
ncbi:MAG: hypothetical protein ACRCYN_01440 [Plesiomonas sp.]